MLKVVIIGKWSEYSAVSVFQVVSLSTELSIAVMSGDIGCWCGLAGSLVGVFVFKVIWLLFCIMSAIRSLWWWIPCLWGHIYVYGHYVVFKLFQMSERVCYVLIICGVVLSGGVSGWYIYILVMSVYLDLLRWIFVICSSVFCMFMLAGICSGVYVMLSFTSVMRPPPALWLLSCLSVV